jgi:hypothetical protein
MLDFETFSSKLGIIQSNFLDVDRTLDIKRDIFGRKRMQDLTEKELDKLMNAYRWEYRRIQKKRDK